MALSEFTLTRIWQPVNTNSNRDVFCETASLPIFFGEKLPLDKRFARLLRIAIKSNKKKKNLFGDVWQKKKKKCKYIHE